MTRQRRARRGRAGADGSPIAVLDLGSNAVRLQVAQVRPDGQFDVVYEERDPIRLGEGIFVAGRLAAGPMNRAVATLERFAALTRRMGVRRVEVAATSAVREAANRAEFLRRVRRKTGLRVEVLSGEREANLIAQGVLSGDLGAADVERLALVDVGGGSTEIIAAVGRSIEYLTSVDVGSVRLTEMFVRSDPVGGQDEKRLRAYARWRLADRVDLARLGACQTLVGSAGTMRALAQVAMAARPGGMVREPQSGLVFATEEIVAASQAVRRMSTSERRRVPGLDDSRADIVVAGAMLVEEILAYVRAQRLIVSRRGLRHGLMVDAVARFLAARADRRPARSAG